MNDRAQLRLERRAAGDDRPQRARVVAAPASRRQLHDPLEHHRDDGHRRDAMALDQLKRALGVEPGRQHDRAAHPGGDHQLAVAVGVEQRRRDQHDRAGVERHDRAGTRRAGRGHPGGRAARPSASPSFRTSGSPCAPRRPEARRRFGGPRGGQPLERTAPGGVVLGSRHDPRDRRVGGRPGRAGRARSSSKITTGGCLALQHRGDLRRAENEVFSGSGSAPSLAAVTTDSTKAAPLRHRIANLRSGAGARSASARASELVRRSIWA